MDCLLYISAALAVLWIAGRVRRRMRARMLGDQVEHPRDE